MSLKYEKWRDLIIDPFSIKFKTIKIKKIINYLPAGNDVVECIGQRNEIPTRFFIKIERSKTADFKSEINNLNILFKNKYYLKIPEIYEYGQVNDKNYIVLSPISGKRLSELLEAKTNQKFKKQLLQKYGNELGLIHKIPSKNFNIAKQRIINEIPSQKHYSNFDFNTTKIINYLKENHPKITFDTFIHGDFHYGNVLWQNRQIIGVVDFEYSGLGFKEQDIAWACILRPNQKFMNNIIDIKEFLKGYLNNGTFNSKSLKWCLINGYLHFYLMNESNKEYRQELLNMIDTIIEYDFNNL